LKNKECSKMDALPLEELRVLDFSRLLPGPYATWILHSFGAEVIRIEPIGGGDWLRDVAKLDESMGWLFQSLNSGKKSVSLDLKSPAGKEIMLSLIKTADVLFETFRPGVMDRLGLGYLDCSKLHPGLVYCSLPGYGTQGPYRDRVGHDLNYIGLTGLLDLNGLGEGPPVIPATQIADIMAGLWAVIGILTALNGRSVSGKGVHVKGSFLGSTLASLPVAISRLKGVKSMGRREGELFGGSVCYNVYATSDDRYMTLAALEPKFWSNFCRLVGKEHLIGEQFAPATSGESTYDEVCELFRRKTLQEWMNLLGNAEVCCEPVLSLTEGLSQVPVQDLGMLEEEGLLTPLTFPSPYPRSHEPVAELGQHTKEVLVGLGYRTEEIERFAAERVVAI
jgi:alpha-methylacyl-CoA racemase